MIRYRCSPSSVSDVSPASMVVIPILSVLPSVPLSYPITRNPSLWIQGGVLSQG